MFGVFNIISVPYTDKVTENLLAVCALLNFMLIIHENYNTVWDSHLKS